MKDLHSLGMQARYLSFYCFQCLISLPSLVSPHSPVSGAASPEIKPPAFYQGETGGGWMHGTWGGGESVEGSKDKRCLYFQPDFSLQRNLQPLVFDALVVEVGVLLISPQPLNLPIFPSYSCRLGISLPSKITTTRLSTGVPRYWSSGQFSSLQFCFISSG